VLPAGEQPFDLTSGEFAELENGYWTKYDKDGVPLERKKTKRNVDYAIKPPICAFTDKGARRIRYEAMEPLIYDPAHGFESLPPVLIRPGEKAIVEAKVYGAPKGFSLTIGRIKRSGSGVFGEFSGINPVKASGNGKNRVRIEIIKRYRPVQTDTTGKGKNK
jgi:hypothetical protein